MKKIAATFICACALIVIKSAPVHALLIIDTGEPTFNGQNYALVSAILLFGTGLVGAFFRKRFV